MAGAPASETAQHGGRGGGDTIGAQHGKKSDEHTSDLGTGHAAIESRLTRGPDWVAGIAGGHQSGQAHQRVGSDVQSGQIDVARYRAEGRRQHVRVAGCRARQPRLPSRSRSAAVAYPGATRYGGGPHYLSTELADADYMNREILEPVQQSPQLALITNRCDDRRPASP